MFFAPQPPSGTSDRSFATQASGSAGPLPADPLFFCFARRLRLRVLLPAALIVAVGDFSPPTFAADPGVVPASRAITPGQRRDEVVSVYDRVKASVVNIHSERTVASNDLDPFRPTVLAPAWLDGDQARAVAACIDHDGRFDEMPILGDALEEAGCCDVRILEHARRPRHYRGCWLIDSILGKG